jgi:hypothetical protein
MSDTPETDAATHDLSDYGSPVLCSWGDWVDADFARKLERERDEARKLFESAKRGSASLNESLDKTLQELREAREQLRIAVGLLSTQPQFADKHPEDVLAFVKEGAK